MSYQIYCEASLMERQVVEAGLQPSVTAALHVMEVSVVYQVVAGSVHVVYLKMVWRGAF